MSEQMKSAGEIIAEELSGLVGAGAGFVPPIQPQSPAPNPHEQKVLRFIQLCRVQDGLTPREIAGGTQLATTDVKVALASMVADGTLTVQGNDENFGNSKRYNLPIAAQEPTPVPVPYESADQRINRLAEVERQRWQRDHPAPQPTQVHYPSDAEIASALLAAEANRKAIRFTPEERAELDRMQGRLVGLNPNIAIVNPKR